MNDSNLPTAQDRQMFKMIKDGLKDIADAHKNLKLYEHIRTIRGIDGHTPTDEELLALIKPLIPDVKDGHTPTDEELLALIKPLIAEIKLPEVKDGHTPTDEELIALIKPLIPKVPEPKEPSDERLEELLRPKIDKAIKSSVLSPFQIRDKLKELKGKDRLPITAIQGLEEYREQIIESSRKSSSMVIGGGANRFSELHDVNRDLGGNVGKVLYVSENGTIDFTTFESISGVDSVANDDGFLTINPNTGNVKVNMTSTDISQWTNDSGYVTSSTGLFVNNATNATLTRSGAGPYTLGINLGNANTWTAQQTFNTTAPIFGTMTAGSVLFAGTSGLLSQDNANFFWDDSNNRLGIGTASPSQKLEVLSTTDAYIHMVRNADTTHAAFAISNNAAYSDTNRFWAVGKRASSESLAIWNWNGAADTIAMTILKDGKVGIGTTAPDKILEINLGTADAFRLTYNDANGSAATYVDTTISSAGAVVFDAAGSAPTFRFNDNVGIGITPTTPLHVEGTVTISSGVLSSSITHLIHQFSAGTGSIRWGGANTRIESINSASDSAVNMSFYTGGDIAFQIAGAATTVNYLAIGSSATTNALRMTATGTDSNISMVLLPKGTGNVGIGNSAFTPTSKLHVVTSTGGVIANFQDSGTGNSWITVGNSSLLTTFGTLNTTISYFFTSGSFDFYTNSVQKLRLAASGGLSVGGTYYSTDAGSNNMILEGTLAIGATSPSTHQLFVSKNQNAFTTLAVSNTNAGTGAQAIFIATNGTAVTNQGVTSTGYTTSGSVVANQGYFYADGAGGMNLIAANASGAIIFSIGAALTEVARITSAGNFQFADTKNFVFNTTTGTKIGTATNQKLALWNATPIVQPTTAVAAATLVSNAGTALTSTDTFDGYTIPQVVKALRNVGLLA